MNLSDKLRKAGVTESAKSITPVWSGPQSKKQNGGITFSLLCKFLVCRESFYCLTVEGLKPKAQFNHRLDYGNMWHLCEEHTENWSIELEKYVQSLCSKYKLQQEEIVKWYNVCKAQYPEYVKFWSNQDERESIENEKIVLMTENVFNVPYILPSGRTIYLRGKWDEVLVKDGGIWLKENKTKGDIDEQNITQQLKADLQTMIYLISLYTDKDEFGNHLDNMGLWWEGWEHCIKGVVYNVVRRPLSGGKHTIVRHKATKNKPEETHDAYYKRLKGLIQDNPEFFFMRWDVKIEEHEVLSFRKHYLDNILEQLCDWWEWIVQCLEKGTDRFNNPIHWIAPFGVFNPMSDGKDTEQGNYIRTGNKVGLEKNEQLFEELQ